MAESAQKSKKNAKSKVDSMTGKRENLGRSCHLNAAYHGKELRSIYPDLRPHDSGFIAYSKVSTLWSGFKNILIRVDRALN